MKVLSSILVLFLFALCASAQDLPNASAGSKVTVIQKSWRSEVRNPSLEVDPLKPNKDREEEARAQNEVAAQNERRNAMGCPNLAPAVRVPSPETGTRGISVTYIYEFKFSNSGEKAIRELVWEYMFFEPGTQREVGRLQFVRKVSISPGKTRNVIVRTSSSPTGTVEATKAGKKPRDQYSDQVVIKSVGYADGSVWQAARK